MRQQQPRLRGTLYWAKELHFTLNVESFTHLIEIVRNLTQNCLRSFWKSPEAGRESDTGATTLSESGCKNVVNGRIHSWKRIGVGVCHGASIKDECSAKSLDTLRVSTASHRRYFHDILQVLKPCRWATQVRGTNLFGGFFCLLSFTHDIVERTKPDCIVSREGCKSVSSIHKDHVTRDLRIKLQECI